MKILDYRGKMIFVPGQIDEFTPAQYRRYLEISMMYERGLFGRPGLRTKLLTLLLGERTDITMQPKHILEDALKLINLTEPFIVVGDRRDALQLNTGANLLPEWEGWKGPGDMLDGLCFGDFIDCHSLLKMISKASSQAEAEKLTSDFCKKLYKNSDKPDIDPDEILCTHALILFNNVMKVLHHEPIDINGEEIDFSILFEKSDKRKPDDHTGWTGAAMEIAETGTFGTYKQVLETSMWDILLFLYRKKFERLHSKV